jgi:type II secretory ATPase GspE/PulE/Tfp pilus assembly ATPase PilB-like protein
MVIRILDTVQKSINFENLGMLRQIRKNFSDAISRSQGMILVTGPTGSGKTTTLYAALKYIYSEEVNIITIEDPIEYNIPGVNQIQVNKKIGITFASGLRSIVRQDPNIIMVGEIRDWDTAAIAFQAALTGHKVFSSLHTNNAVAAITRLINIGIEPYLLSSCLVGVAAQRLIRRNCPHCMAPYRPDPAILNRLNIPQVKENDSIFYRGQGCQQCNFIGYSGRIGIFELLKIDDTIKQLINEKATEKEIFQSARKTGFTTMEENGLYLVLKKLTTFEEIFRAIPSEEISAKNGNQWVRDTKTLFKEDYFKDNPN